jgi:hypothetical protein
MSSTLVDCASILAKFRAFQDRVRIAKEADRRLKRLAASEVEEQSYGRRYKQQYNRRKKLHKKASDLWATLDSENLVADMPVETVSTLGRLRETLFRFGDLGEGFWENRLAVDGLLARLGESIVALGCENEAIYQANEPPRWEVVSRTLWVDRLPITYHREALNQFKILEAFEKAGWPEASIVSPLIGVHQTKNTLDNLNKKLKDTRLHFSRNSTKMRILWSFAPL